MPIFDYNETIPYLAVLIADRGFVKHWGIYLGNSQVFHCTPEKGEHVSTLNEFCKDIKVTYQSTAPDRRFIIYSLINEHLRYPRRYDLITNNCEQIVREIATGIRESKQLQGWAFIGIVGLVAIVLSQPESRRSPRYN